METAPKRLCGGEARAARGDLKQLRSWEAGQPVPGCSEKPFEAQT